MESVEDEFVPDNNEVEDLKRWIKSNFPDRSKRVGRLLEFIDEPRIREVVEEDLALILNEASEHYF